MKERYLRHRELGRGGFGTVYLAEDQSTGRLVALKELRDPSPDARERFRSEVLVLFRLNNRFIVELLDQDLDAELPYLVLEYCAGGPLRSWVGQNRGWKEVASVLSQVILGLTSIHEARGFHRDLKPDNILIASAPGQEPILIKIADFGLARLPDRPSGTITRTAAGTDGYIAPEVLGGAPFHSGADIYSLGIVATELLTGTRNPSALNGVKLPPSFHELVLSMCSVDSTRRPVVQQIAVALTAILAPPRPRVLPPATAALRASSVGAGPIFGGIAVFTAALLGLAALADGSSGWDASVRRYRGLDGRFK